VRPRVQPTARGLPTRPWVRPPAWRAAWWFLSSWILTARIGEVGIHNDSNSCTSIRIITFVRAAAFRSATPADRIARMLLIVDRYLVVNEVAVHDEVMLCRERSEVTGSANRKPDVELI
jgi:hypothetical protein